ncbi:MAG: DUF72 domain-containing protein [Nitrososphaeraceae archaeon]
MIQLPPSMGTVEGVNGLGDIIPELDKRFRYAAEVRDSSWFQDLAYSFFANNNICMVWSQLAGISRSIRCTLLMSKIYSVINIHVYEIDLHISPKIDTSSRNIGASYLIFERTEGHWLGNNRESQAIDECLSIYVDWHNNGKKVSSLAIILKIL